MNLKKCTALLLVTLMLFSNIEFALNVHHCADEIASITLRNEEVSQFKEKGCCETISSKTKGCCKDKVFYFQKKSSNATLKVFFFEINSPFVAPELQPIIFSRISTFTSTKSISYYCDANAPPLFKLYNQYIFYA